MFRRDRELVFSSGTLIFSKRLSDQKAGDDEMGLEHDSRIPGFLETLGRNVSCRSLPDILGVLKLPLPVFHPEGLTVHRNRDDLNRANMNLVFAMDSAKINIFRFEILKVASEPPHYRSACLVRGLFLDHSGLVARESKIRYFFEFERTELRIAMIEYKQAAFGEIFEGRLARVK